MWKNENLKLPAIPYNKAFVKFGVNYTILEKILILFTHPVSNNN